MKKYLPKVAYFCMEFGLKNEFKIYAGGLGILAGDFLKGAKEQNLPVVGIGIKWKQGYTEQSIDQQGNIHHNFRNYYYDFLIDTGKEVLVQIKKKDVWCKIWKVNCFENADLFLLDTDIKENEDTWITRRLYSGYAEQRIAQEMILGIGGIRALRALGIPIDIYHFNEGHAAFAGIELIREKMNKGASFKKAWEKTRTEVVFTTHTPVKAGNEKHEIKSLLAMGSNLHLSQKQLCFLGGRPFNMTVASLRLAGKSNAVSKLHQKTANKMWERTRNKSEIIGITNAIHVGTWVDKRMRNDFFDLDEMWYYHMEIKHELIDFIKERQKISLNPDKLLIGFSRRAAPYKRSTLIFRDENRIKNYLEDAKIQIIFSGKSHPQNIIGKSVISNLLKMSRKYPRSVVFIENYDMEIGRRMTSGCDVWLNNPRRLKEASGTSGMKAAMNGVLNFSILDGWWPEVCQDGINGWAIGEKDFPNTIEKQDKKDAKALYDILLRKIIPTYYNHHQEWLKMMHNSIYSTKKYFSIHRMLDDYFRLLYVKQ